MTKFGIFLKPGKYYWQVMVETTNPYQTRITRNEINLTLNQIIFKSLSNLI